MGQLVVLAYVVPLGIAYVPAGALADRATPGVVLRLGLLLFVVGSLAVAVAPDLTLIVVGRVFQGVGAAAAVSAGQVVASVSLGAERAGRGLGLVHVAVALGMLGGPLVGGVLLDRADWRILFLAEIPVAVMGAALAGPRPSPTPASVGPRAEAPARGSLLRPLTLALVIFVAISANTFLVPYLLQRPFALPPSVAGLLLAIVPVVILVGAIPGGDLADRYGSRLPSALGGALLAVGVAAFAFATHLHSVPTLAAALLVYGAGAALFQAPNNRSVLGAAPGGIGLASGLLGLVRQSGQALGVLIAGGLVARGGGLDAAPSYITAFVVLAGLAAAAAALALTGPSDRPATAVRVDAGRRR